MSNIVQSLEETSLVFYPFSLCSLLFISMQKKLDQAVLYRSNVRNRLELHVQTLDQLNSALHLLEELRDMENKIDAIYLPIGKCGLALFKFSHKISWHFGGKL